MSSTALNKKFSTSPPRSICLEEPCLAWTGRVCGHSIVYGSGACLYDDPVRCDQRAKRLYRKAMIGSVSRRLVDYDREFLVNTVHGFSLVPFVQRVPLSSRYSPSSFEFFYYFMKEDRDLKFNAFKSRILRKFKHA